METSVHNPYSHLFRGIAFLVAALVAVLAALSAFGFAVAWIVGL